MSIQHHANDTAELSPARQSIAGNHHIHLKIRPLVGKIQAKRLPRATLIQLSDVRLNYFPVQPRMYSIYRSKIFETNKLRIYLGINFWCLLITANFIPA